MLKQSFTFAGAFFNLFIRILFVPAALSSWLAQLASQWKTLLALFLVGGGFYLIAYYGGDVIREVEFGMRCRVNPIYHEFVRPIFAGIIREFFNRIVCWYDAIIWFPYGFGRNVVFPVFREGGFGPMVSAFARFLSQIGKDVFIGYFFTTNWLVTPVNLDNVYVKWAEFWTKWQSLWCYSCNDLCLYMTNVPVIPAIFTSSQIKDPQWMCFWGNSFNAFMAFNRMLVRLVREIVYPTATKPFVDFIDLRETFDFLCKASTCFWKSWENAMQLFWDTFIPFKFIWQDVLCFLDVLTCVIFKSINLAINFLTHAADVVLHFAAKDSTWWNGPFREDFTEVINLFGTASYFPMISVPIQNTTQTMNITTYQLLSTEIGTPWGKPNPIYNMTNAGQCFCIALTRVLCDPENNGTTCMDRFNGTLLTGIDPCCITNAIGPLVSDSLSSVFEFTLHVNTIENFMIFLDKQPFTTLIRDDLINVFSCAFSLFRAVKVYGFCIERVLTEITVFVFSTIELLIRIVVSLIQLPYFQAFLPQTCNFVSCPGDSALNMSLAYLDRIADMNDPNGLTNCLCFILNNGFNVPYAGCHNISCVPSGFIPPIMNKRDRRVYRTSMFESESVYDFMTGYLGSNRDYRDQLNPIMKYGRDNGNKNGILFSFDDVYNNAPKAISESAHSLYYLDQKIANFNKQNKCSATPSGCSISRSSKRDLIYNNFTDMMDLNCTDPLNPPPCFNLCCIFSKLIQLSAHTVAFGARALNAAFQTRFTDGSTYWNGKACPASDCLTSDVVTEVVLLAAPLECLCQFIKLILPPQGFGDPCCAFSVAGELLSVLLQIIINVGNSLAGDSPEFFYIRGNQTFNATMAAEGGPTGIPLVDDFTVALSLARTLFDCVCNFIRTIFQVAFSGLGLEHGFDPCCMFRVYFRAILEAIRVGMRLVLSLSMLDSIPSQQYLYVNGYKNARPYSPFFIGDIGFVRDLKNITALLLAPPVSEEVSMGCAAVTPLEMSDPNQEGLPTCICRLVSAVLVLVNKIDDEFKGDMNAASKCLVNLCCPIFSAGKAIKGTIDFLIELTATVWQNWEYKKDFQVAPQFAPENFYIPQETLNYFFCDEYAGLENNNPFFPDGVTPNPFYSASYISVAMTQVFYAPFVQNKPNYPTGFIPNPGVNATTGVVNPNAVYDPNNPMLQLAKCGRVEPILASIQNLLANCLCMGGNASQPFSYATSTLRPTCGLDNPDANGLANVLDALIRWMLAFVTRFSQIFPKQMIWPECLCCGGQGNRQGVIWPLANVITVGLRQLIELIRNIPNPTYWTMNGGSLSDIPSGSQSQQGFVLTGLNTDLDDIRRTWINRFLAPFADALCTFITNCGCFLSMILGDTCLDPRYMVISSVVRYILEAMIQFIALIEGFIKMISDEQPGLCVGGPITQGNAYGPFESLNLASQGSVGEYQEMVPTCSPVAGATFGITYQGLNPDQLGRMAVAFFQFIVDALIGFSELSCSSLCPSVPTRDSACNCLNLSPYRQWGDVAVFGVDRCNTAWNYYFGVNGFFTMYLANGGLASFYPPGSPGRATFAGIDVGTWEEITCTKFIPGLGEVTSICGDVCKLWMQFVWCPLNNDTVLNPAPGDPLACASIITGAPDTFSGSMQKRYGVQIWQYKSEEACPGANLNYCQAIAPEGYTITNGTFQNLIDLTVQQTSQLVAQVPNLVQGNFTPYDTALCESNAFGHLYGTSTARPLGLYPIILTGGYTDLKTTSEFYGACGWWNDQCNKQSFKQKIMDVYSWANLIYQNTGWTGPNPWLWCCFLHSVVGNWTQVMQTSLDSNSTVYDPQLVALFQFYGEAGPIVTILYNANQQYCVDPRYEEYKYLSASLGCGFPDLWIGGVFSIIPVWMRNCIYGGAGSQNIAQFTYKNALSYANEAAATCYRAPSFCIFGIPAVYPNLNFQDRWGLQESNYPFAMRMGEIPDMRYVGQCARCRLEANGTCRVQGLKPKTYQPVCDRVSCIAQGLCKNDLMVPCSALNNPAILDGVITAALRYFYCLSTNIFGAGSGFTDLFGIVLTLLKFFWQISGALIRLVVTLLLVVLDIFIAFIRDFDAGILNALLNSILAPLKISIIAFQHFQPVLNAFVGIFQVPLASRDLTFAQLYGGIVNSQMRVAYSFDDGHDCIEKDPMYCLCRVLNLTPLCRVVGGNLLFNESGVTVRRVLSLVKDKFEGGNNCDMLWNHLDALAVTNWTADVPYAERYQAIECLTQRAKGESFHRAMPQIPEDFFYNPKSMFVVVNDIITSLTPKPPPRTASKRSEHNSRQERMEFEQYMKMPRDVYAKYINTRSYKLQKNIKEQYGITKDSLAFDFILKMDVFYYKFASGYYGYLWNRSTFYDHFGGHHYESRMNAFNEAAEKVKSLAEETYVTVEEKITNIVRRDLPQVRMPQGLRMMYDGTLFRGLYNRFFPGSSSGFQGFKVNFGKLEFENIFSKLWFFNIEPTWTPAMTQRWNAGKRMFHSMAHTVWPHYTSKENYERFVVNGDCRLYDGFVELGTRVVDYCVNDFVENTPVAKDSLLGDYLRQTSHLRKNSFFRKKIVWQNNSDDTYKRPKLVYPERENKRHIFPREVYKRATAPNFGPIGNFLLDVIYDITGIDLIQTIDNFFVDLKNFFNNPNTKESDYPDVGLKYWAYFMIRCEFPENLNCAAGIGLGKALIQVGIIYWVTFFVLAIFFPSILSALSIIFNFIVYFLIVAIVAWHYSPACLILFPASELSPGVTIPILPIPLNIFPALPMCLWDDVIQILDEVFAACYTWIPTQFQPMCLTCDQRIMVPDCSDVGITNPVNSIIFWGYRLFGSSFCDWSLNIASILSFVPGLLSETRDTCTLLMTSSEEQLVRNYLCGGLSAGTWAWIAIILYAIGVFVAVMGLALLNVLHALILLLPTIFIFDVMTSMDKPQTYMEVEQPGDDEDEEELNVVVKQRNDGVGNFIAGQLRKLLPHEKVE